MMADRAGRRKKKANNSLSFEQSVRRNLELWKENAVIEEADYEAYGIKSSIYARDAVVIDFPHTLSATQRHVVHEVASSLGLYHGTRKA